MKLSFIRKQSKLSLTCSLEGNRPEDMQRDDPLKTDAILGNTCMQTGGFNGFVHSSFLNYMTAGLMVLIVLTSFTAFCVFRFLICPILLPVSIIYFIFALYRPYYYILAFFFLVLWSSFLL